MDSFTYISVLLSIVLGLAITQVLLGFRGTHTDQGESEDVYPDSDMGGNCAPESDSGVVGRLRHAQGAQLDIFGASRDHAASDQYLHGCSACFAGHQRMKNSSTFGSTFSCIEAGSLLLCLPGCIQPIKGSDASWASALLMFTLKRFLNPNSEIETADFTD